MIRGHQTPLTHTQRGTGQSLTVALWPVRQWVTVFWGQRASTVRMDLVQRPGSHPFIHSVQFRSHTPAPGKKHNSMRGVTGWVNFAPQIYSLHTFFFNDISCIFSVFILHLV